MFADVTRDIVEYVTRDLQSAVSLKSGFNSKSPVDIRRYGMIANKTTIPQSPNDLDISKHVPWFILQQ